jgi:hypothetical protein
MTGGEVALRNIAVDIGLIVGGEDRAPDMRGARPGPDRVMPEEHNPVTRIDCRCCAGQGQLAEKKQQQPIGQPDNPKSYDGNSKRGGHAGNTRSQALR